MPDTYTIDAVDLPMPLDTLIKVGMLVDVEGHGDGLTIAAISLTFQPRRDPAAEGTKVSNHAAATTVEVPQIEAALLPYAVFDLDKGSWCYGRQIRRVYNDGSEHEG